MLHSNKVFDPSAIRNFLKIRHYVEQSTLATQTYLKQKNKEIVDTATLWGISAGGIVVSRCVLFPFNTSSRVYGVAHSYVSVRVSCTHSGIATVTGSWCVRTRNDRSALRHRVTRFVVVTRAAQGRFAPYSTGGGGGRRALQRPRNRNGAARSGTKLSFFTVAARSGTRLSFFTVAARSGLSYRVNELFSLPVCRGR